MVVSLIPGGEQGGEELGNFLECKERHTFKDENMIRLAEKKRQAIYLLVQSECLIGYGVYSDATTIEYIREPD